MGQATVDLPDPLQNTKPVAAQSADDLLSQLAGEEIDRLLAESESDAPPGEPQPHAAATVVEAIPPIAPGVDIAPRIDLDSVLDNAIAERVALHIDAADAHAADLIESVDSPPHIELGDSARRLPLILRPLEWLSSPLDPWPDQLREIMGKVGVMTLINALAVIAYVMLHRHHVRLP